MATGFKDNKGNFHPTNNKKTVIGLSTGNPKIPYMGFFNTTRSCWKDVFNPDIHDIHFSENRRFIRSEEVQNALKNRTKLWNNEDFESHKKHQVKLKEPYIYMEMPFSKDSLVGYGVQYPDDMDYGRVS